MVLRLVCHPFHNGLHGVGMGAGPLRLVGDPALATDLRGAGLFPAVVAGNSLDANGRVARAAMRVIATARALAQEAG